MYLLVHKLDISTLNKCKDRKKEDLWCGPYWRAALKSE